MKILLTLLTCLLVTLKMQASTWSSAAQWIGTADQDQCLYSPYLAVFRLSVTLKAARPTDEISIYWGADDERLMSAALNNYGLHST